MNPACSVSLPYYIIFTILVIWIRSFNALVTQTNCESAKGYWLETRCYIRFAETSNQAFADRQAFCQNYATTTFGAIGQLATLPGYMKYYHAMFLFMTLYSNGNKTALGLQATGPGWMNFRWVGADGSTTPYTYNLDYSFWFDAPWGTPTALCGFIQGCSSLLVNSECGQWWPPVVSIMCEIYNTGGPAFYYPSAAMTDFTCQSAMTNQTCIQYGGFFCNGSCYVKSACSPYDGQTGLNWQNAMFYCGMSDWLLFGTQSYAKLAHIYDSNTLTALQSYSPMDTELTWIGLKTACLYNYDSLYWWNYDHPNTWNIFSEKQHNWTGVPVCNYTDQCFFLDWASKSSETLWRVNDCSNYSYNTKPMHTLCQYTCQPSVTVSSACAPVSQANCLYTVTSTSSASTSLTTSSIATTTTSTIKTSTTTFLTTISSTVGTSSSTSSLPTTVSSVVGTSSSTVALSITDSSTGGSRSSTGSLSTTDSLTSPSIYKSTSSSTIFTTTTRKNSSISSSSTSGAIGLAQTTSTFYDIIIKAEIPPALHDKIATTSAAQDAIVYLTSSLSDTVKLELGYQFDDMISNCTYAGVPCTERDFKRLYDPTYGNCYSFNFGIDPLISRGAGTYYGKRMISRATDIWHNIAKFYPQRVKLYWNNIGSSVGIFGNIC